MAECAPCVQESSFNSTNHQQTTTNTHPYACRIKRMHPVLRAFSCLTYPFHRDPACGYDFVREAGYSREDFLARTEAYSSYSRQKLETRRGEDQYAARVDKLECPQ